MELGYMWYSASILFESVHNEKMDVNDMWEEQIVLIVANSEEEARAEAEKIGKEREHRYISATGDHVQWEFRQVEAIFELFDNELRPGTEVFSRFLRASEVTSLLTPFGEETG
jgi:hypothetical protein